MSRQSRFLTFGIIVFIMYAFGIHTFEAICLPSQIGSFNGFSISWYRYLCNYQIRFSTNQILKHGINVTKGIYDNPDDEGDLNHFKALTTALSATAGIGNTDVATAMYYGGLIGWVTFLELL